MDKPLSKIIILKAFNLMDARLKKPVTLILGGGGCMILAHGYPLSTMDVDPQILIRD